MSGTPEPIPSMPMTCALMRGQGPIDLGVAPEVNRGVDRLQWLPPAVGCPVRFAFRWPREGGMTHKNPRHR